MAGLKDLFARTHRIRLEERDAAWDEAEIKALDHVLAMLPRAFVSANPNIKAIVRQREYSGDHESAPGHGMYRANVAGKKDYLVLYDKGMYSSPGELDFGLMTRTVIHEISHSLDDELPGPFSEWLRITGWFRDGGQWLCKSHEFVNNYAASHPKEDFAESFSSYVLEPERLMRASPSRYEFMDNLFNGNGAA